MTSYELLLIGGGAGVGKTTVAWEASTALRASGIAHCLIEGDFMDQIHPATTVRQRLAQREIGSQLTAHINRSLHMAHHLATEAPPGTVRIATDGLTVQEIAAQVIRAAAW